MYRYSLDYYARTLSGRTRSSSLDNGDYSALVSFAQVSSMEQTKTKTGLGWKASKTAKQHGAEETRASSHEML